MIALEVLLNGKRLCIAGAGDLGVVSANLCWVRRKPVPEGVEVVGWTPEELYINVGGIDSVTDEHLEWVRREIEVGCEVTVRVIEVDAVDVPDARWPVTLPPPRVG